MNGSYGASLVVRALGTWAVIYGFLINIGGPERWGNPAYDVANLMPGSPYTWAVIILVAGMLTMLGSLITNKLPLPGFSFNRPDIVVESWKGNWIPKFKKTTRRQVVNWNKTQVRNIGLYILAAWWLLFGVALIIGAWHAPDIGYGAGGDKVVFAVVSIIMTKVKEPIRYEQVG